MAGDSLNYQAGQPFNCPACGKSSIVKIVTKMDGWTPVGQFYACAICKKELQPVESKSASDKKTESSGDKSLSRLADFLATEPETRTQADQALGITDDLGLFCKNCRHFYKHPFMDKCLLHQRKTNPMNDCPQFELREEKSEK